uniref:Uncharacterized protein n=1 Tax=Panagrolaimus sp. ES5 TaxID=591445 RepID=A0AC34FIQ4_9BILA
MNFKQHKKGVTNMIPHFLFFLYVSTPLSNSYRSSALTAPTSAAAATTISSTATIPAGLIHNTFCTTPLQKQQQNFVNTLTSTSKQPSLFGSTIPAATAKVVGGGSGDADWRKEELQNITSIKTSTTTTSTVTPFSGKTTAIEKDSERRSFYLGGDDDSCGEEGEEDGNNGEDSDFEDEIESLIDTSDDEESDYQHSQIFPLDDDSGIGTISTEPSLEDEMADRPSELISLPRSIRIGSVGRRGIMRTPRGRKQRLQFTGKLI